MWKKKNLRTLTWFFCKCWFSNSQILFGATFFSIILLFYCIIKWLCSWLKHNVLLYTQFDNFNSRLCMPHLSLSKYPFICSSFKMIIPFSVHFIYLLLLPLTESIIIYLLLCEYCRAYELIFSFFFISANGHEFYYFTLTCYTAKRLVDSQGNTMLYCL